ncbi:sulfur carrier protein ThiS [Deinococcus peraridilitoris]|uniref:Thiamine biosynthesis protein ThiS n=1 Tax=Deinococcus peraridilitoris (strain DSM 19664 / LMG 22246 / CIP 109416 / KR-200) TaxID=937777 RepID=K9ZYH7_DEIPD|nr:sulfur carrier protein ThiS [Deinococcus peraridilitoris]AFZ65810.1 thiamine biosynthesis protein ThiS [Deinococcus peraridilitoris DSM 19664]
MWVNGQERPHRAGLTLHTLLQELNVALDKVAVAHNDDFYAGSRVPDVPLQKGDVIEVVRVTAGG